MGEGGTHAESWAPNLHTRRLGLPQAHAREMQKAALARVNGRAASLLLTAARVASWQPSALSEE